MLQEYYTKNFELPAQFIALNGAIQYFELTSLVDLTVAPIAKDATDAEKEKYAAEVAAAQANYLRILEILRSRGAQPVITHVAEKVLGFTLEQTWVYGESMKENAAKEQVSAHDLVAEAEEIIPALFKGISKFKAESETVDGKTVWDVVEVEAANADENLLVESVKIMRTAGSLNSDAISE